MSSLFRRVLKFGLPSLIVLGVSDAKVTFRTVVKSVYLNNPSIKSARCSKFSTDESVAQAFSEYYPDISMKLTNNLEKVRNYSQNVLKESQERKYSSTAAITFSQNLFNGRGTTHKVNYSYANVNAARAKYFSQEQKVILNALHAFMDVWAAKQYLNNAIKMRDNMKEVLAARRVQLNSGEIKIQDYASIESALYSAEARVIGCQGQLQSAYAALKSFTGEDYKDEPTLPVTLDKLLPDTLKDFRVKAERSNNDALAARFSVDAAREYVDVVSAGFAPRIDLNAQIGRTWEHKKRTKGTNVLFGYTNSVERNLENETTYVGLSMRVPLWQNGGKNISSYVRQADEMLLKAEFEYRATLQNIRSECAKVWNNYVSAVDNEKQAKEAVRAATVALDGYRRSEMVGAESSTNVVYNENKLLDARDKYIASKVQKFKAMLEAEYFMGALNATYFKLKPYDSVLIEHEKAVRHAPLRF